MDCPDTEGEAALRKRGPKSVIGGGFDATVIAMIQPNGEFS
jgi:hypothetical protein